jgi:hypothetical protein
MSKAAQQIEVEPLFGSTHGALVFAFNFSHQAYDRPMMNRMSDGPKRSGKGLVGLDGAGQAGLIRAEVSRLNPAEAMVVTARFAPRRDRCECRQSCCSGWRPGREWKESVDWLTEYVLRMALSGCVSHYRLRNGIVRKVFGEKVSIIELAEQADVNRDTAAEHNKRISKHLLGLEGRASKTLDQRFYEAGLIEPFIAEKS